MNIQKLSSLLVMMCFLMLLLGCTKEHKYYTTTITKQGQITLETLSEILNKHNLDSQSLAEFQKSALGIDDVNNIDFEAYRMGIKILEGDTGLYFFVIDTCDSLLSYDTAEDYPGYTNRIREGKSSYLYYDIEKLKKLGYVSSDRTQQKDLCIFSKSTSESGIPPYIETYSSNILTYTAEEINKIVQQYEEMQ